MNVSNVQVSLDKTRGFGPTDLIGNIGEARTIEERPGWPISDCILAHIVGRYTVGILV